MKIIKIWIAISASFLLCIGTSYSSDLSISVAGSEHENFAQKITYRDAKSHFHVVLTNTSNKPLKIWDERNSWGYESLSFIFRDNSGREYSAKKSPIIFTRNFPSALTIMPGGSHVFDVYYGDLEEWKGFPIPEDGIMVGSIEATFEINSTPESETLQVWTGHVVSEAKMVEFQRWKTISLSP